MTGHRNPKPEGTGITSYFDIPVDRTGTSALKWEKYRGRDIIPLWVADMDLPCPSAVRDALRARAAHPVYGYTAVPEALTDAVLQWLQTRYSWQVDPKWLVWLPGLVTGINVACRAVGEPGDDIVTAVPVYPPFLSAPAHFQKHCRTFAMEPDKNGTPRLDPEKLEAALTPRTKLLLLCSPHNPAGRLFDRQELQQIAAVCRRHGVTVCSDEIHCDLILEPDRDHIPFASLSEETAAGTITLMAPSKTFNVPGLGCSFAVISSPGLRDSFRRAMQGIVPHVNLMGYTAAYAAYTEGGSWLREVIGYLRQNRDLAHKEVNAVDGLTARLPEATYLMWIDASGLRTADPARFFEHAGVGLSAGRDFGSPDFVRLNFACPRPLLRRALARMKAARTAQCGRPAAV